MKNLRYFLKEYDTKYDIGGNYIFYLATPPSMYEVIAVNLAKAGLCNQDNGFRRIIIEKPFGYDLESAKKLNKTLHDLTSEDQIFRIDHYLGKETVQNLLVTRFANGMFEPLWNRNYIDRIEITSAENIGVEQEEDIMILPEHSGIWFRTIFFRWLDLQQWNHLLRLMRMHQK